MCMSTNCNLCFPSIVNAVSDLLRSVVMIKHLILEEKKVEDLSAAWTACSLPYLYSSAAIFNGTVPSFHY